MTPAIPAALANPTAVVRRTATAIRHPRYWLLLLSGFLEPPLYLLSIGTGVGVMLADVHVADGGGTSYAAFVASAMLAAQAMQGALAEGLNLFFKSRYSRLYDSMLATPVRPVDILVGELAWAVGRGMVYSTGFVLLMYALGLITPAGVVPAVAAAFVVAVAFAAGGALLATYLRGMHDLDHVAVAQLALFLFSGTFTPVESYPLPLRVVVELTPLHHGVELVRAATAGAVAPATLWHLGYLLAFTAATAALAQRRAGRLLGR